MTEQELIAYNRRLLDAELRALKVQPLCTAGLMHSDATLDEKLQQPDAHVAALARDLAGKAPRYAFVQTESAEAWVERIADEAAHTGRSVQEYLKQTYLPPSEARKVAKSKAG